MKNNNYNPDYVYKYGFSDNTKEIFSTDKGLNEDVIKTISSEKQEHDWLLEKRLQAYKLFNQLKNPNWGPDLNFINFNDYIYYVKHSEKRNNKWEDIPEKIKNTFEKLGIKEAEAKYLNGVATQYDSEMIYHSMIDEFTKQGVIFTDTDTAAKKYPELFQKYFGKLVPPSDNKYAALNTAVWSGGSFIYVPKGVKLNKPLQSYFRINYEQAGQFERTLIIVDDDASLHYVEGCTAPIYSSNNLHAAVVEIYVGKNATCRYTTIQNWSDNVLNLVTKRALVEENGKMSWIDGNIGSNTNMKYPACILKGNNAVGECITIAVSKPSTIQDTGAKMIHLGKNTKSRIISKGICMDKSQNTYRGFVKIGKLAENASANVQCDTLMLSNDAITKTIPYEIIENDSSFINHEAKISKISDEQLFYLMSKGISKQKAEQLIVFGFLDEFAKELPMEYAVELNRLIKLDMEGSIG